MSRSRHRPVVLILLVALLGALGPASSGSTSAPAATRFDGTAAEEAVAVSQALFPASATTAALARDDGAGTAPYAPGVAAAAGGPVLMTGQLSVPSETLAELTRLGVGTVVLMGDDATIDTAVAAALAGAGYTVERVLTAVQAAERIADGSDVPVAFLVDAAEMSEQLLAGPAAGAAGGVVLEATPGTLPPAVEAFLTTHAVEHAVLVGSMGQGALAEALAAALEALDVTTTPLFGRTLEETGVALAESGFRDPAAMTLVGQAFPHDALIASGLGAATGAPMLFVDDLTDLFASFVAGTLSAHAVSVQDLWIVGGQLSVADAQVDEALALLVPIQPFPLEDVGPGLLGEAHTVVSGIDPVTFDVEVIDVIPGGVAPGLDLILIRASGPVIDDTMGIVSGMSGSPVYVDDGGERKLLGAVAYGCFSCDQTIGGVTPAEDMLEVLTYPGKPTPPAPVASRSVRARVGGREVEIRQLELPLAIGGLTQPRIAKVAADLERAGFEFRTHRAATVGDPVFEPFDPLFPGHSWAGAMAAGTLTSGGIGTTTYRAGDRSLAFGHPFLFEGPSGFALFSARISTVIPDPGQLFGGYKQGSMTGAHGTMDQDRLAAVAGSEGIFPLAGRIETRVRNLDTSVVRSGRTYAPMSPFFPDIGALSLLATMDRTFDRIGEGTVLLTWTIEGRDESGAPFSVSVGNRYASEFDASFEGIWDLLDALYLIQENDFEEVTFDRVDADARMTQLVMQRRIVAARARVGGHGWKREGATLRARPGQRIIVEVTLHQRREPQVRRKLAVRVPRSAFGRGSLRVTGGTGFGGEFFFFDHEGPSGGAQGLDDVLAGIEAQGRNDVLTLRLQVPSRKGTAEESRLTQWELSGRARFRVRVVR